MRIVKVKGVQPARPEKMRRKKENNFLKFDFPA